MKKVFNDQQQILKDVLNTTLQETNLPAEWRDMQARIYQSLLALAEYNQAVFQHVADNLADNDNNTADSFWNIRTVLAPVAKEKLFETKGFLPMPGWFSGNADSNAKKTRLLPLESPLFLNVPYVDLDKYLDVEYKGEFQGKPFIYKLKSFQGYCAVEKDLAAIAELYGIKKPLVFSPWARRAVWLEMPQDKQQAGDFNDLRLEANGLEDVLITDHILMWNVDWTEFEDNQTSSAAPDPENPLFKRIYRNCDEKTFILPRIPEANHVDFAHLFPERPVLEDGKLTIYSPKEIGKQCLRMEIKDILPDAGADNPVFANDCHLSEILGLERARTRGELNLLLKAMSNALFQTDLADDTGKRLPHYQNSRHHLYPNMNTLSLQQQPKTPVYFACQTKRTDCLNFVQDYVEYVCNYLSGRYPEFDWRGVQK